jgi:prolyl oligopeptidase
MKKTSYILLSAFIGLNMSMQAQIKYPDTPKKPVQDKIHNFKNTDQYRWLEDKANPEVKEWSHKEHQFTLDFVKNKYKDVVGLKNEIIAYLDRDYLSSPFFKADREFFYARKKGEQQNKIYTRIKGKEIKIFDPEVYDKNGKASISSFDLTEDASKAAVGIQYSGNEIQEVRIIDTKNGKVLGEPIKGLNDFSWTKDEKHAYISIRTQEMIDKQLPVSTYLHKIGDDRKNDKFLLAPKDAKDFASIYDSDEGDVTFTNEGDFYSNTLKIKKTGGADNFKLIFSSKEFKATPIVKNNKIYYFTNDNAPNFKIMVADLDNPEYSNWKTFIGEKKDAVIEGFAISKDYVILQEKREVLSRLSAYDLNGKFIKNIELPETGDVASISYHKESNSVYVGISTFQSTSKLYKLDGKSLEWKFIFQDNPPIDTKDIVSEMVYYYSADSVKVPMFLIHKKDVKLDGNNPTLLYGYGGFNISMQPSFVGMTASFINRGGVYAIACLRGGAEYGESWHRDGMLMKKQNTFNDFIAAAEFLIANKYTNPSKLAVKGGSNGGLLIGATITQRPDLFKAAICAVPLLDMLRYHKFLIARYWIPEYGDPDKQEDFLNILKYSPYQNIKPGFNYPATMVKTGENDTRVDALHAKKFAAALQNNPGQEDPILLFIDFESGHGSGQSIEQMAENNYLEWKFLMGELGM